MLSLPRALPQLGERSSIAVKTVWFALLAFALVGTTFGTWAIGTSMRESYRTWAELGLRVSPGRDGRAIVHPRGENARRLGISPNSLLLAVNGTAVTEGDAEKALRDAGTSPLVRLASPGEAPRELRLVRSLRNALERDPGLPVSYATLPNITLASQFAINIALLAVAILLFRRRPRDPVAMLLSAGMLLMVGSNVGFLDIPQLARVQQLTVQSGLTMIFTGLFAFPDGRFQPRWTLVGIPLALLYLADGLSGASNGIVLFPALMGLAVAAVAHRYAVLPPGPARQQVKWSLLGFAAGFACILAQIVRFSMEGSVAGDVAASMWMQLLGVFFYTAIYLAIALGLLVSLLRYRLYDADAAISRSAGYAVLTLLLAGTFGASAKAIEWFFETSFGRDAGAMPGAIGAGLAVVLITPMHNRIHRWAERRFQKALLHLRRDLPDCVGDLRETAAMPELLDEVLARVEAGTRAVRSAVTIDGETVAARGEEGDLPLTVPLRIGHRQAEIGALLVGPRPDGSLPGKDEREALAEIADPVARAIRIVRERERREARADARARDSETRIAAVEAALAKLGGLKPESEPC